MLGRCCRVKQDCELAKLFAFKKDHSGLVWEVNRPCRNMREEFVDRGHGS